MPAKPPRPRNREPGASWPIRRRAAATRSQPMPPGGQAPPDHLELTQAVRADTVEIAATRFGRGHNASVDVNEALVLWPPHCGIEMPPTGLHELLRAELGWMEGRCIRAARSARGVDPHDLLQGALAELLSKADRWLAESSRVSPRAQLRALFGYCLRHQLDREVSARFVEGGRLGVELGEDGEPREIDFDDLQGTSGEESFHVYLRGQQRAKLIDAVPRVESPGRRLALLTVYLPELATRADFREAAEGKAAFLLRSPAEAWELFEQVSPRSGLVSDGKEWKKVLARLLRWSGPPEEMPRARELSQVNALEQAAHRGLEDVKRLLRKDGSR